MVCIRYCSLEGGVEVAAVLPKKVSDYNELQAMIRIISQQMETAENTRSRQYLILLYI